MGRKMAALVGGWLVIKNLINLVISFSVGNMVSLLVSLLILFTFCAGIPYVNYVVAILMAVVVIKNLPYNISHVQILYLIEAVIDAAGVCILLANKEVREYFKKL